MPTVPEAAPQEPLRRYSNIAVAFHWVTVALVLFQLWLGFSFADMTRGPERDHLFTWHRTVGAIILLGGIGYAIDEWRGTAPWFLLGGLLLGLIVGFYELAKTVWGQDARRNG